VTIAAPAERLYGLSYEQRVRLVNRLTLFRFYSGPGIGAVAIFFGTEQFLTPVTYWVIVALVTDLEGFLARHLKAVTPEGAALDPKADGSLFIGVGVYGLVAKGFSWIVFFQYYVPILGLICYAVAAGWMRKHGQIKETSLLAKVNIWIVGAGAMLAFAHATLKLPDYVEILAVKCLWAGFILSMPTLDNYRDIYKKSLRAATTLEKE